jgi:hypothetical protein
MSSDLLEINDDCHGNSVLLKMNFAGNAFLSILDERLPPTVASYTLKADKEGIENAKAISEALQTWISHVEQLLPEG